MQNSTDLDTRGDSIVERFEAFSDRLSALVEDPRSAQIGIFLLLFFLLSQNPSADRDLFARVAMGRLIVTTQTIPKIDPFAFTPTKAVWIDHEWLSGLLFYGVSRGGDYALFGFALIAATQSFVFLWYAQRELLGGRSSITSHLVILAACINGAYLWSSTVRSQVVTFLFLSYLLYGFARYVKLGEWRILVVLPALFAIWANAHGGVVAGLGLFGAFVVGEVAKGGMRRHSKLAALFISSVITTGVTPYGALPYWKYLFEAVMMPRPGIPEWQPLDLFQLPAVIPLVLLGLLLLGLGRERGLRDLSSLILLGVSACAGFSSQRLIGIFLCVVVVFGTRPIEVAVQSFGMGRIATPGRRSILVVLLGLELFLGMRALLWVISFLNSPHSEFSLSYQKYPVDALEWLRYHRRGGKLLVSFNEGSYALWRLFPAFRVSIDGRYEEVYLQETVDLVARALDVGHPGQPEALAAIGPDYALIDGNSRAAREPSRFGRGWHQIYADRSFVLFERSNVEVSQIVESVIPQFDPWNPLF